MIMAAAKAPTIVDGWEVGRVREGAESREDDARQKLIQGKIFNLITVNEAT